MIPTIIYGRVNRPSSIFKISLISTFDNILCTITRTRYLNRHNKKSVKLFFESYGIEGLLEDFFRDGIAKLRRIM